MADPEFWLLYVPTLTALIRTWYPVHCKSLDPGGLPLTLSVSPVCPPDNLLSSWLVTISVHNLSFLTLFPDHWSLCSSRWSQDPANALGDPLGPGPLRLVTGSQGPLDADSGSPTSPFWIQKPVPRRQSVRQSLGWVSHMDCSEWCLTTYTDHHQNLSSSSQHHFIYKTSSNNTTQDCVIPSSQSTRVTIHDKMVGWFI